MVADSRLFLYSSARSFADSRIVWVGVRVRSRVGDICFFQGKAHIARTALASSRIAVSYDIPYQYTSKYYISGIVEKKTRKKGASYNVWGHESHVLGAIRNAAGPVDTIRNVCLLHTRSMTMIRFARRQVQYRMPTTTSQLQYR